MDEKISYNKINFWPAEPSRPSRLHGGAFRDQMSSMKIGVAFEARKNSAGTSELYGTFSARRSSPERYGDWMVLYELSGPRGACMILAKFFSAWHRLTRTSDLGGANVIIWSRIGEKSQI